MSADNKPDKEHASDYSLIPFFYLSSDLLCIAGFDAYFKKINPAVSKLLGYSEDELYAKPINSFIHPEDQELTDKHRRNIRMGKPLLNFENRYVSKQGKTIWLSWTSIPVPEQKLVYAIAKNITHKKEQEEQRNQILSRLTESNQRLKQLNYATSHDLRSPVNNLKAIISLIENTSIQDTETLELIQLLKKASNNLKNTLDNYDKELRGNETLQVKVEDINIEEILNTVKQSTDSLIKDANARFEVNLEALSSIKFNWTYLESILLNLITNAIKYAHPERDPVISITSQIDNGTKQLLFSDNGQGFDSEKLKGKVFGLHQQFHDHKDSRGIGLYLVYNHMMNLGGNITVESKIDEGTTFTLTFKD